MKKLLTSIFLVSFLLAMTTGIVFAQDATSITGTVQSIVLETDAITGDTTVLVSYTDDTSATQTVRLNTDIAASLGLVTTDPTTGETTVNDGVVGTEVTIDPARVIANPTTGEDLHPVGSALSDFFSSLLGVNYDTIMTYHRDGVGFGVIAQALWFSNELDGGTDTFTALLDAKISGDYSNITLADGTTPRNWGDVIKSLKKGDNLGSVSSGHANNESGYESSKQGYGNSSNPDAVGKKQNHGNGENIENIGGNNGNGHLNGSGNGNKGHPIAGGNNSHGKP
jgi:hypothetical protein